MWSSNRSSSRPLWVRTGTDLNAVDVVFKSVPVRTHKGRELVVRPFGGGDFEALVRMYKSFEPKRVAQGIPPPDVPRIAHWLDRLTQKSEALLAWKDSAVVAHTDRKSVV